MWEGEGSGGGGDVSGLEFFPLICDLVFLFCCYT